MKSTESDSLGPVSGAFGSRFVTHLDGSIIEFREHFVSDTSGLKRKLQEGAVSSGLAVRPIWLSISQSERYLFLEDKDTGDVLLPLIYMKGMFEANYSRKLSSLKHRLVSIPENVKFDRPRGFVYWQWAFESPHEVKVLVRKMLGEENTPQGHLRLILLPIVFNAMAQKAKLRQSPFFRELHKAVKASTYWPLLKLPSLDDDQSSSMQDLLNDQVDSRKSSQFFPSPLPSPLARDNTLSAKKTQGSCCNAAKLSHSNNSSFDSILSISQPDLTLGTSRVDFDQLNNAKSENSNKQEQKWKNGTMGEWNTEKEPETLNLMNLNHLKWGEKESDVSLEMSASRDRNSDSAGDQQIQNRLFHGPYDLQKTIAKYCLSYEAAEENENRKNKNNSSGQSNSLDDDTRLRSDLDLLKIQSTEIRSDVKKLRTECQEQMNSVCSELQQLKHCLSELVSFFSKDSKETLKSVITGGDGKNMAMENVITPFSRMHSHSQSSSSTSLSPHSYSPQTHPSLSASGSPFSASHDLNASLEVSQSRMGFSNSGSTMNTLVSGFSSLSELSKPSKRLFHSNLRMDSDASQLAANASWSKSNLHHGQSQVGQGYSQNQNQIQTKSNDLNQMLSVHNLQQQQQQQQQNYGSLFKIHSQNQSGWSNSQIQNEENSSLNHHQQSMKMHQLMPETPQSSNASSHWALPSSAELQGFSKNTGISRWGNKAL